MKRVFLFEIIIFLTIFPIISALNLEVVQKTDDAAMIIGSDMPTMIDLEIKNNGEDQSLIFYNFFGYDTLPKGSVYILSGETKIIPVGIYPREDLKQQGKVIFELYIQGENGDQMTVPLTIKIVKLEDAFEIGAEEFKPDSNNVSVYIKNKINLNFNNINATFKSSFFDFEKVFSIGSYKKQVFEVTLDKEEFRELMAGIYPLEAKVNAREQSAGIKGTMKFSEEDIVTDYQNEYGIIVYTKTISKVNEGNVISVASTILKKNIISRLFTTFSPEPLLVERQGLDVYYTWETELKPGEKIDIVVRTNWLLPLLAILLIVSVVILTKQLSRKNLSLKKRVSFVRAKGGEFALRVSIIVSARKFVEKINVIDRLPMLVKIHEKFGGEMPKKIEEKNRRIEWYFDKLQQGESRTISYIIYSKVGILGKFALPTTRAVYEREGEIHDTESNHTFFMAEQIRKPIE